MIAANEKTKVKAYVHSGNGTTSILIDEVKVEMDEKKEAAIKNSFKRNVQALEFVGGTTYSFRANGTGSRAIKSSSLEELFEMYKAFKFRLPIPERKCFFYSKK